MTFKGIDREGKKFWVRQISDREIAKAHQEDKLARSGVSLVIGCPLPATIQSRLLAMQERLDKALRRQKADTSVSWRTDLAGLHTTVYGLVKPRDYRRPWSWPLAARVVHGVRSVVYQHQPFALYLEGVCILGRGAVAVRISDSKELNAIRTNIERVAGVSKRAYGKRVNQMIVGRLLPPLTNADRATIRRILPDLKGCRLGRIDVSVLELVHYRHEFLDRVYHQSSVALSE